MIRIQGTNGVALLVSAAQSFKALGGMEVDPETNATLERAYIRLVNICECAIDHSAAITIVHSIVPNFNY